MKNEVVKNYLPLVITSAIKEYATNELGLSASVQELKWKEVANIQYKIHELTESHLIGTSDLRSDILQSVFYLIEKGYHVENFNVSHQSTKGIVFMHPNQLEKL